ncbi:hypothetical protein [Neobacillus massiliamazoniensis]|uniref:Uncharacterized protein n=1 Tax=Neobacillus massiliamazoniensis TaxID=1499688 RepID=A0A0U1NZ73_9BACI|nr:hypothetical protein [Neobacillus massiliamazoniensis]CRK83329.1 hypothetical protein BN000_03293 [Neobacillus massiliamazoniensis]
MDRILEITNLKKNYKNFSLKGINITLDRDNRVLKDTVRSFNLDLSGYQEFTHDDLNLKVGDNLNDHSEKISLQHLFVGSSIGTMRLFLENGLEGTKGYFLYKRIDGNNVLKELHKKGKVWVVMSVYENNAARLKLKPFNWNKCTEN